MKVKDILLSAALKLGIAEGVKTYFDEGDNTYEQEALLLLDCFSTVENDLALNYFPLRAEDLLRTVTGAVQFSAFAHSPVRIISVKNDEGKEVEFSVYPQYLKTGAGTFQVTYTYTPDKVAIEDEGNFGIAVPENLIVFGVLAEFCIVQGRFEEGTIWEKKYKEAIERVYKLGTCTRLKSRTWI